MKKDIILITVGLLTVLSLVGCGGDKKKYVGSYKMINSSDVYLEIEKDGNASLSDWMSNQVGVWEVQEDGSILMKLSQIGTQHYRAYFDQNKEDILWVEGSWVSGDEKPFIRVGSKEYNSIDWDNIDAYLKGLLGDAGSEKDSVTDNSESTGDENADNQENDINIDEIKETFDAFEGLTLIYKGTAPEGTAEIDASKAVLDKSAFELDNNANLSNGDKIVVKIIEDKINDIIIEKQAKPETMEKEFTVEGLVEYVSSTSQIPQEVIDKIQKEAADKATADAARLRQVSEVTASVSKIVVMTRKADKSNNIIYAVVKRNIVFNDKTSKPVEPLDYFTYMGYRDIKILPDGKLDIVYSSYETPGLGKSFYVNGASLDVTGYKAEDDLISDCVLSKADEYEYEILDITQNGNSSASSDNLDALKFVSYAFTYKTNNEQLEDYGYSNTLDYPDQLEACDYSIEANFCMDDKNLVRIAQTKINITNEDVFRKMGFNDDDIRAFKTYFFCDEDRDKQFNLTIIEGSYQTINYKEGQDKKSYSQDVFGFVVDELNEQTMMGCKFSDNCFGIAECSINYTCSSDNFDDFVGTYETMMGDSSVKVTKNKDGLLVLDTSKCGQFTRQDYDNEIVLARIGKNYFSYDYSVGSYINTGTVVYFEDDGTMGIYFLGDLDVTTYTRK